MLLAVLDLLILLAAGAACLLRPTRLAAWILVICSALWLPLNNGHLEGPVLVTVDIQHGLTASDLIGYAGWIIAGVTLHRIGGPRDPERWLSVAAAAAVLVCGLAVSYYAQP